MAFIEAGVGGIRLVRTCQATNEAIYLCFFMIWLTCTYQRYVLFSFAELSRGGYKSDMVSQYGKDQLSGIIGRGEETV